jgi:hypothetical protein
MSPGAGQNSPLVCRFDFRRRLCGNCDQSISPGDRMNRILDWLRARLQILRVTFMACNIWLRIVAIPAESIRLRVSLWNSKLNREKRLQRRHSELGIAGFSLGYCKAISGPLGPNFAIIIGAPSTEALCWGGRAFSDRATKLTCEGSGV